MNARARSFRFVVFIGFVLLAGHLFLRDHGAIIDENAHLEQMQTFLSGKFRVIEQLSTFPTYNLLLAGFAFVIQDASLQAARFYTLFFAVLAIGLFYLLARRAAPDSARERTLGFLLFPIILPYFFILYTDVASLVTLLAALYCCERGWFARSALASAAAVLMRQSNIVWAAFFCLWVLAAKAKDRGAKLAAALLYAGIFAAFAVFVKQNQGIALGDRLMHPMWPPHLGNVYFALFIHFFLFLPQNIANAGRIAGLVRRRPYVLLLPAAVFLLYYFTFRNDHPYNQDDRIFFFRNTILVYFNSSPLRKALFFVPAAYSILSLCVTRLREKRHYLLYPAAIAFLSSSWLIEHRYDIVPFVFLMLFSEPRSSRVERAAIAWYAAISLIFMYKINYHVFFL